MDSTLSMANVLRRSALAALLLGVLGFAACDQVPDQEASAPAAAAAGAAQVMTTFYPTTYFAERIAAGGGTGGKSDLVRVECPLPPGADPIHWQPSVEVIGRFQSAEVIVLNGASFELWASTASLPMSRVVDTARVFESEFLRYETTAHSHGAAGAHAHEGIDGHTWLDPKNAERQAEQILIAMSRRWPSHERHFRDGFAALKADLDDLDRRLLAVGPQMSNVAILASHPAYNYLARRYRWPLVNVDVPPDQALTPARLEQLKRAMSASGRARAVLLFESAPEESAASSLALVEGLTPVVFEPAENVSSDRLGSGENYISIMRKNVQNLASAVGASARNGS